MGVPDEVAAKPSSGGPRRIESQPFSPATLSSCESRSCAASLPGPRAPVEAFKRPISTMLALGGLASTTTASGVRGVSACGGVPVRLNDVPPQAAHTHKQNKSGIVDFRVPAHSFQRFSRGLVRMSSRGSIGLSNVAKASAPPGRHTPRGEMTYSLPPVSAAVADAAAAAAARLLLTQKSQPYVIERVKRRY